MDLGEPVDDQLLDQWAAHGDFVEFRDELVVTFAAPVLGQGGPHGPHMGAGARREAGDDLPAVAVVLLDDDLRHEQLDVALLHQRPDRRDHPLTVDVPGGVKPDGGIDQ